MLYLKYFRHLAQILVIWIAGLMATLLVGLFFSSSWQKSNYLQEAFRVSRASGRPLVVKWMKTCFFSFSKFLFLLKGLILILSILAIFSYLWTMLDMNAFNIHIAYVIYSLVLLFRSLCYVNSLNHIFSSPI